MATEENKIISEKKMPVVSIQIAYDLKTGKCAVVAPMNNKGLCYAILKAARVAIRDYSKVLVSSKEQILHSL